MVSLKYDLGEQTHAFDSCWMPKPVPPRNQYTGWFAPALKHLMMDYVRVWASPTYYVHSIMRLYLFLSDTSNCSLERKVQAVDTRCQDGYMPCTYHELLAVTCKVCHFPAAFKVMEFGKENTSVRSAVKFTNCWEHMTRQSFCFSWRGISYWVSRASLFLCSLSLLYEKTKHK